MNKKQQLIAFFLFILLMLFGCCSGSIFIPTLSQACFSMVATTVGELAMFAGGRTETENSNVIDIYNLTSNSWITSTLSQYSASVATTVGELAMFAGGYNSYNGNPNVVDIYNLTSNSWSTTTLSLYGASAATTVGELAMFAGGSNGTGYPNIVDIYNLTSNSWSTTTLLQYDSSAATTVGELAMFAGGSNGTAYSNIVDIYNLTSNSWSTATLSQYGASVAATVGELAMFAGGYNGTGYPNVVDIYILTSNSWITTTLSQYGASAATTVGELAMFAGGYNGTGYSNIVDIYNLTSNSWSTAILSQARAGLAATTVGELAMFAGGQSDYGASDQVDIYNLTSNSWIPTCPAGTWDNQNGVSISCPNCSAGMYSNTTNAIACVSCPEGTYSYIGASACTLCPAGTFSNTLAAYDSTTCVLCSSGTYSNQGAASCTICPNGQSSPAGSSYCSPVHAYSNQNTAVIIVPVVLISLFAVGAIGLSMYWRWKYKNRAVWTQIDNIKILERLGGGNFGDVYRGIWNGTTDVALKQLKSKEHFEEFLHEASMLHALNHPNVVRFFGIYTASKSENYIVMEYLCEGSLDRVLKVCKKQISIIDIIGMAKDAAAGMLYLNQQSIVHRDLALRNLLVASTGNPGTKYIIKITDFGMARTMAKGYYKTDDKIIPVRWCALEVLQYGTFSFQSDVWAFGVVLWEMFSYGMIPYTGMSNAEVIEKVITGYRLNSPENCPDQIYKLMFTCWNAQPERRPTFKQLYDGIKNIWVQCKQNQPVNNLTNVIVSDSYTI